MAKDSPRTTAGDLQKIVKSSGSENLKKNCQTSPTSLHVWEGFKKNYPSSSKNKLQHIQLSDTTGTSHGTDFYDQMKLKISFLAANTRDGFGEHRDKSRKYFDHLSKEQNKGISE